MEIKIITHNGQFIDAVANDCDLIGWGDKWIINSEEYFNIEFWNGGFIHVDEFDWGASLLFKGDNGIIILEVKKINI